VVILGKRKKEVGIFPTFLVTSWGTSPICVALLVIASTSPILQTLITLIHATRGPWGGYKGAALHDFDELLDRDLIVAVQVHLLRNVVPGAGQRVTCHQWHVTYQCRARHVTMWDTSSTACHVTYHARVYTCVDDDAPGASHLSHV
jgi:hypothetical protein